MKISRETNSPKMYSSFQRLFVQHIILHTLRSFVSASTNSSRSLTVSVIRCVVNFPLSVRPRTFCDNRFEKALLLITLSSCTAVVHFEALPPPSTEIAKKEKKIRIENGTGMPRCKLIKQQQVKSYVTLGEMKIFQSVLRRQ